MGNMIKRCREDSSAANTSAPSRKSRPLIGEKLTRNVLIAAFALACIVSARDMALSPDQSVLSVLKTGIEREWDDNLGRLVYASSTLSVASAVFSPSQQLLHQPCNAQIADVFSAKSPYIVYQPAGKVYAAADCEVTAVLRSDEHGAYAVRTYCGNGLECLYFGLSSCFVSEGDVLPALADLGACDENQLIFEVRRKGVPVDASALFVSGQVQ